jgi:leucyl aminopeptidase
VKVQLTYSTKSHKSDQLILIAAYKKQDKLSLPWPSEYQKSFKSVNHSDVFKAEPGEIFWFSLSNGTTVAALGMGEKDKVTLENIRLQMATSYKIAKMKFKSLSIDLDSFKVKNLEDTVSAVSEGILLSNYSFEKYLSKKISPILKDIYLETKEKKNSKCDLALQKSSVVSECINFTRDLVDEPPNYLHSETYAHLIQKDAAKLKHVHCKILGRLDLKKEKMGMFLSVNAGSAHEPRLVHLTYQPSKATSKTKHVVLIGKGLTFDTGGYSLKSGDSMKGMKYDMAGSATVYGAFRAAALLNAPIKVTCLMGLTDNAVSENATMPDSIVTARNGKTVEILNTDAEGRLVLGDILSYASDMKPTAILDAATLTGAVLVALGSEIAGLMGNDQNLIDELLKHARETDEHLWQLPIIEPFRKEMKSKIADLKNIADSRFAGTAKAAAFLENFVTPGIPWAHFDIAGVAESQKHLTYCPEKGASGLMVRTILSYILNG